MGRRGIRGSKARVAQECCISRGGQMNNGGIQAEGVQRIHNVGRCGISRRSRDAAGGTAPGVRAAKSFEFREGE